MGFEFITRSLKTTAVLLLVFLPFGMYYVGLYEALSVFSGGVWGILNMMFISSLVRASIRPDGADKSIVIKVAFFKFPVLYLSGFFLLKISQFEPAYLMIGFSSLFAIFLLRAVGRVITGADNYSPNKRIQES